MDAIRIDQAEQLRPQAAFWAGAARLGCLASDLLPGAKAIGKPLKSGFSGQLGKKVNDELVRMKAPKIRFR